MTYQADTQQTNDRDSGMSSSPISSAPQSPQNGQHNASSDTIHVARIPGFASGDGVVAAPSATSANTTAYATTSGDATSKSGTASAPEKPKRQRKKKEVGPDGKPIADDKPKKTRKPREPKDPNKPAAAPRKKQKTGEATEKITQTPPPTSTPHSRQPTISDMMMAGQTHQPPAQPIPQTAQPPQPYHTASESVVRSSVPPHLSNPAPSRPSSSGQNYDPIRGQNYDPIRGSTIESSRPSAPPPTIPSNGPSSAQASPHVNRTSASPSIASLVHPPPTTAQSSAPAGYPQQTYPQPHFVPSQQQSPPPKPTTNFSLPPPQASPPTTKPTPATMDGAMDVDAPQCDNPPLQAPEMKKAPSKSSSSAPTPKETAKAPTVPKASGTGLLSSSNLFGGPAAADNSDRKNVDIEIVIPLNPQGGNTVNIAQEIIKKYGQDAINPRAAAHRAQLLRLSAQQSKMEGNTTDDMSVDLMSDNEGDSNVEMGGMDSGADGAEKPKRKRRAKQEEYDKEDDFIDDTELAWQEQAAVAKDGFFVYSGPLVPEGQQAQVESSAPTRGGRGRGRGRGRGATTSGTTHASLAAEKKAEGPGSRGGKGSRGGGRGTGVTRKPRMTKADRERMEADKQERERAAGMMAQQSGSSQLSTGQTPMPGPSAAQQPAVPTMQAQGYPQMASRVAS